MKLIALLTGAAIAVAAPGVARGAPPVASLSASPSVVRFAGSGTTSVELTNLGPTRLVVAAAAAGVDVDLRGRPAVASRRARRSAAPWLAVRPRAVTIAPRGRERVEVSARVPPGARPGDHHALVLFATRARDLGGVGVRMRFGIRVVVRVPGPVVHRIVVCAVHVRPRHVLEIALANLGNVTEPLPRGRITATIGRDVLRGPGTRRELLPDSMGVVSVRYSGPLRGRTLVRVRIGAVLAGSFRVRL